MLESGEWGRTEEGWVGRFESEFAAYQDAKFCVAVNSGTAALMIALKAAGVEYGDEVILPPYTFLATATACLAVNAKPVWCDICEDTLTLDPNGLESLITNRTRAVIPVLVAGTPCHMDEIGAITDRHGIAIIEDACQAHGAVYQGRKVGALGAAGAFSFQWSKNVAAGEGGAMVTDHEDVFHVAWTHHNAGRDRRDFSRGCVAMSWNLRMPSFQAGMLVPQVRRCQELFNRRSSNMAYLRGQLEGFPGIELQSVPGNDSESAYHLLLGRVIPSRFRDITKTQFLSAMSAEGIPFSGGYNPLYRAEMFRRDDAGTSPVERQTGLEIDPRETDCPVCERLCDSEAFWGTQRMLLGDENDMDDIVKALRKLYENADEARNAR